MSRTNQILVGPNMEIHDPEYGDMTDDVAAELARMRHEADVQAYVEAPRRQARIAQVCGQESVQHKNGLRLVAQIDQDVFNYWEIREGREFWKHELGYMLKRHPQLAVKPVNPNPVFGYTGQRRGVRGKRGRWAA